MNLQELLNRLNELEAENTALKTHAPYGILTRAALELEKRKLTGAQYAIFSDIDNMHSLNIKHGYETVNAMIREALQIRSDDLLLTGLWFSGDEIVFIIRSDPMGFCERVRSAFAFHGIGITLDFAQIQNNDLNQAIETAAKRVQAIKALKKVSRK